MTASKDFLHVVVEGDTLSALCWQHYKNATARTFTALANYNRIPNPNLIEVGQTVAIPPTARELKRRVRMGELYWSAPDAVEEPSPAPQAPDGINLGLPGAAVITSSYGTRVDPITGAAGSFHPGWDIAWAGCLGAPIPAPFACRVAVAGPVQGYGNTVILDGEPGPCLLYAHLDRIDVSAGEVLAAGEIIGLLGQTGRVTGPHIHLEYQSDLEDDGWQWGQGEDPSGTISLN